MPGWIDADAEVDSILGQRRQRARRRFFPAVREDDHRGVLEGIAAGASHNQVNTDGETPILVASRLGHERIVRILLDAGANADTRKAPLFATALYWAVVQGHTAIALLLIERGANVSIMTAERDSPLLAATRHNHTDIALALLQAGRASTRRSLRRHAASERDRKGQPRRRQGASPAPIPTSPTTTMAGRRCSPPSKGGNKRSSSCCWMPAPRRMVPTRRAKPRSTSRAGRGEARS